MLPKRIACLTGIAALALAGCATIFDVASSGDAVRARTLLKDNPGLLSTRDETGRTPLYLAALNGHEEVVQAMIDAGADVNTDSPVQAAAMSGHARVVEILLRAKASFKAGSDVTNSPLNAAARNGHVDVVKVLLAAGIADDIQEEDDVNTALAAGGREDGIVALLESIQRKFQAVRAELRRKAMRMAYDQARAVGTVAALERFLKDWPDSQMEGDAKTLLDDALFAMTQATPARQNCIAYFARFKAGRHAGQVDAIQQRLEMDKKLASVVASGVRSDLSAFIEANHGNDGIAAVRAALEGRDRVVRDHCRAVLGAQIDQLMSGNLYIEDCEWTQVSNFAFQGVFLGILFSVADGSEPLTLDRPGTFLTLKDGSLLGLSALQLSRGQWAIATSEAFRMTSDFSAGASRHFHLLFPKPSSGAKRLSIAGREFQMSR